MDLAVLEVLHSALQIAVVGVLVRQQFHVLAYGLRSLIPESYSTTVVALIVIECVLDRQVLDIRTGHVLRDTQRSRLIDRLGLSVRCVLDDHAVHRLTDDRDVILTDGREHRLTKVIQSVRQEDLITLLCLRQRHDERSCVSSRNHDITSCLVLLNKVLYVVNGHFMQIVLTAGVLELE